MLKRLFRSSSGVHKFIVSAALYKPWRRALGAYSMLFTQISLYKMLNILNEGQKTVNNILKFVTGGNIRLARTTVPSPHTHTQKPDVRERPPKLILLYN